MTVHRPFTGSSIIYQSHAKDTPIAWHEIEAVVPLFWRGLSPKLGGLANLISSSYLSPILGKSQLISSRASSPIPHQVTLHYSHFSLARA